jgi:hypothetical protein
MVSELVVVSVVLPLAPVMVRVEVPVAAELLAVSVSVDVALPPDEGVTELGENEAVTPAGNPEALKVTAESKPLMLSTVMVLAPEAPCAIDWLPDESDTENDGDASLLTVSAMVVLADKLPLAPLMVMVDEPVAAELLAASVNTLDPVVGLVSNDADTPLGKPVAESVTLPSKPSAGLTVMVLVPDAP